MIVFVSTFTSLERATCLTCFFVVRNNAVQYRSNVKWCHLIWATLYIGATTPGKVSIYQIDVFISQYVVDNLTNCGTGTL